MVSKLVTYKARVQHPIDQSTMSHNQMHVTRNAKLMLAYKPEVFPVPVCHKVAHPTVSNLVSNDKCQRTVASLQNNNNHVNTNTFYSCLYQQTFWHLLRIRESKPGFMGPWLTVTLALISVKCVNLDLKKKLCRFGFLSWILQRKTIVAAFLQA